MQALLFPVDPDWYAVDMQVGREVVPAPAVTPIPTAPATVIGVFNLRGEIVPLFDTAALLGLGSGSDMAFAVVVATPRGLAALTATGLPEATTLGEPLAASETQGTLATYAAGTRVVTLLDPEALLVPAHVGAAR